MFFVGIVTFVSLFVAMSIIIIRQDVIKEPFIIWQSKAMAAIFVIKDVVFLLQAIGVGAHAYVHNGWNRRSIYQYLALMLPVRLLLVIGRTLYIFNGIDGGICVMEVSMRKSKSPLTYIFFFICSHPFFTNPHTYTQIGFSLSIFRCFL